MAALFANNAKNVANFKQALEPLVVDGAPYSAIGILELKFLRDHLRLSQQFEFDTMSDCLDGYTHWQYGSGSHVSTA